MVAVCAYPKQLEQVAAGNTEAKPPHNWSHQSTRRLIRLTPPIEGLWPTYTHANCVCNEIVASTNRVLGQVPLPSPKGLFNLGRSIRVLAARVGRWPALDRDEFVAKFVGRRRSRYQTALESLDREPLCRRDAFVNAFVKPEKFSPYDKVNPDPRMIQFRNARYNIELGRTIRNAEEKLYRLKGPTGLRCVAKGLNMRDRARLLEIKMSQFQNPVVYSMDASRFDKHVSRDVLALEHTFWKRTCEQDVAKLLAWQFRNRVRTQQGCKYIADANRMSGDMNTGCGNIVLMLGMMYAAADRLQLVRWDLFDDGDDCLLIVDRLEEGKLKTIQAEFLEFGQEIKLENRAEEMEQVVFCQCKPVRLTAGWIMTRNWRKVLSQDCCGVRRWDIPKLVPQMLNAIGQCELAIHAGCPIIQEFGLACIRNGDGKVPKGFFDDEEIYYKLGRGNSPQDMEFAPCDITMDVRRSFERAYGVTPEDQLAIEAKLRSWVIDTYVARDGGLEITSAWKLDVKPTDPVLCYSV